MDSYVLKVNKHSQHLVKVQMKRCVCVRACVCVYICVCMYTYVCVHMYACMCVYLYESLSACVFMQS